jgi:hypothetical protein
VNANRTLNLLKRTRRCMTTLQLLATLRAEGGISKTTVRKELDALLAGGSVTLVAGVYYVLTRELNRARNAHLKDIHAYLTRNGNCRRKAVIDALGISAVFLSWVVESRTQSRVKITRAEGRDLLSTSGRTTTPPVPTKRAVPLAFQTTPQPHPSSTHETLLARVLEGVRTAKERRDSVTRLIARLDLSRETILECARDLAQRGLLDIQQGLLTVLVFLKDAPVQEDAPAPALAARPLPTPAPRPHGQRAPVQQPAARPAPAPRTLPRQGPAPSPGCTSRTLPPVLTGSPTRSAPSRTRRGGLEVPYERTRLSRACTRAGIPRDGPGARARPDRGTHPAGRATARTGPARTAHARHASHRQEP